MIVHYFVAGRCILTEVDPDPPRVGDERAIDGVNYQAGRVVRHIDGCPPDHVNVHLEIAGAESLWPIGHP